MLPSGPSTTVVTPWRTKPSFEALVRVEQRLAGVVVSVDEAGCQNQPGQIEGLGGAHVAGGTDEGDAVSGDADRKLLRRRAVAVDDPGTGEQDVDLGPGIGSASERKRQEGRARDCLERSIVTAFHGGQSTSASSPRDSEPNDGVLAHQLKHHGVRVDDDALGLEVDQEVDGGGFTCIECDQFTRLLEVR